MKHLLRFAMCAITIAIPSVAWSAEEEIEALAKGAVHEAYAEPSERQPTASPVIAKEPPKPIEELPPDQKPEGENVQWIPGYWAYDEDRKDFIWVSGFWRVPPPARTWMAGSWQKTGEGWQWAGGFWAPVQEQKAEIEYLAAPPKPLDEDGASIPAPSADQIYVPGSWVHRSRYVWRPGYWTAYRENWVWMPAHYRWTPNGYIFIDGYWDYPLGGRGVLFAPCYIPPAIYGAPTYVYTPTYIIREPCLYGAFFCRRGYGSYYFGDYFAPNYATIGFTAWSGHVSATVRLGGYHDPLFSYYSIGHARDPYWGGGGLTSLYVGRYRGDYARPPVNFTQQNVVINNIRTTNVTNVKNVTNYNNVQMLSTLKDAPTTTNVRLTNVSKDVRKQQQIQANELRTVASNRASQETKLFASNGPMKGTTSAPRTLNVDVPKNLQPTIVVPTIVNSKPGQTIPKSDRLSSSGVNVDPKFNANPMTKVDPKVINPNVPMKIDPKVVNPNVPMKIDPKVVNPNVPMKIDPKVINAPVLPKVDPKVINPPVLPKVNNPPVLPKVNNPPVLPKVDPPVPPKMNVLPKTGGTTTLPSGPAPRLDPKPDPKTPVTGGTSGSGTTTGSGGTTTPRPAPKPPAKPKGN